jgi:hypothetical protein
MNIKLQVCSLELSKRLEELGVKQTSLFWYVDFPGQVGFPLSENLMRCYSEGVRKYSAFTVAELGEMLPPFIEDDSYRLIYYKFKETYACDYIHIDEGDCYAFIDAESVKEADARAKMLIYLIENKLINQEIADES